MAAPSTPNANTVRSILPPERERPADAYAIDGAVPALALRPQSRTEVAALLAAANESGLVVVPQGGRTALRLGRPLERYDIALDLTGLDQVIAYEPADLTLTVEAGLSLERLQALLGRQAQYLSADPPPHDGVTVGGMLATARPGAWRGLLPAARDLILGVQVALPDGTLVRSGGRVVKNVSGYDLHRLHTGALGAFGVIVEASLKVAPLPAATCSFAVRCDQLAQAEALAFDVWDRSLATRALTLLAPAAAVATSLPRAPYLLVEFAGTAPAVESSTGALHEAAAAARGAVEPTDHAPWARLRTLAGAFAGDGEPVVLRIGVPPSELRAAIEAAAQAGCTAWGHLAAGSVIAHAPSLDAATVRSLREQATVAGGFLQIESAPASLRTEVDPFGPRERALTEALRQQFDPSGTLNRGRWTEGP